VSNKFEERAMKVVEPEQFQHLSDLEVHHRPTGTSVSTYRYTDPADACSSIHVNFGKEDEAYDRMEIVRVACELLRKSAHR
jgi:hypothetical protein